MERVSSVKQTIVAVNPVVPVFRYIPKCRHKDRELPFNKYTNPKSTTKVEPKFDETSWHVLKEKGVLLVHKANPSKLTKAPLLGFVASSKGSLQEESDLPKMRTSDRFDPNAYELMKKFGYEFSQPTSLGLVIEAKPYGLNNTQRVIQSQ